MDKKKYKRKVISLERKIEILDFLKKGERNSAASKHFNLGESTIRAIKNNEIAIRKSIIDGTELSSKLSSYARDTLLEKTEQALRIFIEDLTKKRIPISGYLLQEKARKFYGEVEKLEPSTDSCSGGNKKFIASNGWLARFLKRNALHNLKIRGDAASADQEAAKKFPETLAKIIEDGGYSPDQVFNADETGLFWKKMPDRTYIAKSEKKASGFKASKDRVTLLLCSNASGDKILKPLLVNRFLRPRALKGKDIKQLPVHWMANTKAWVTTALFTEWFTNCFLPEVELYMKQKALDFKVLLILDNAPGHLHLEHNNVKILFLPPNTTSIIQPLDQGIIATFKKYYIKSTYRNILDKIKNETSTLSDIWKNFTILDCLNYVASAITELRPHTLNACWKAIWPGCVKVNSIIETESISAEIVNLAHRFGGEGFDTFNLKDIDELLMDTVISDDDIIDLTYNNNNEPENEDIVEEIPVPLTANIILEGLQLCRKLENHFIINDTNSERAFRFQRELKKSISGYEELHKELVDDIRKSEQTLITNWIVRKRKSTQNNDEIDVDSTTAHTIPSEEDSDFEPYRKSQRKLSYSDDSL